MNKRPSHHLYRKIYKQHHGSIPKDENGKSYHIHHIDGNCHNNEPSNLIALSAKDHYNTHYAQGDWGACAKLASREFLSSEEISEIARRGAAKSYETQLARGTFKISDPVLAKKFANERIKNGTHNWQDKEAASTRELKKIKNGTHNFVTNHPNKDHTLYVWENVKTGERLELTQREFILKFGASQGNVSTVARNNSKRKIVSGHRIITTPSE